MLDSTSTANPVFYRTYSRRTDFGRESWEQVCDRTLKALERLGRLTLEEIALVTKNMKNMKSLPSGRWLWVGGTEWLENPVNFSGAYNCTSTNLTGWNSFALMMDLAMMGCGTGAVIEPKYYQKIPKILNKINVTIFGKPGEVDAENRQEHTTWINAGDGQFILYVGDSRSAWVDAYKLLLEASSNSLYGGNINLSVCLSHVRPNGTPLKSFGGVANPIKLQDLFLRCSAILNKAVGRHLTSVECCLLIDEAASVVVAGNIRRCLPGDALVHTESGLVPIEKIRIGDRVLTSKGFYPVTNFFIQGEQSLCRIQTQDSSIECTPDHKVAVLTDVYGNYKMVKARDLQPGDRLIFVPQAIPGTATELPEFPNKIEGKAKHIAIPALTTDIAYFIGYLQGNGSVSSDGSKVRIAVPESSPEILDRLINIGKDFGLHTYTLFTPKQRHAKAFELQFNSTALNQYLKQFKQPFKCPNIPDCILLSKANIREAYLTGLADSDGCHSQKVLVSSVHKKFLQQVYSLYASLGVTTRLCGSIRKRTNKWEGELTTVGEIAHKKVKDIFEKYSLQYFSQKGKDPKTFKDHGFPKSMVFPFVNSYQYGWGTKQEQMIIPTLKKHIPETTDLIPIKFVSIEFDVRTTFTYDIEVANIHEFVCEGLLVSNSAGMRQFSSYDNEAASAKANLWQQTPDGWRIDPEKDALRMANHTRVFHQKPSLQDCLDSVSSQFWSGEGAIQWAGEAVARANADVVTLENKTEFLRAYERSTAIKWFGKHGINEIDAKERLQRYGLNPCVTADTWIHTEKGARQVKDLIGKQTSVYINGELFSTARQGFWLTGIKPVLKVITQEGYELRLTGNHQLLKVTAQTQKKQYFEWTETKNLNPGDYILVHNHREAQHWNSFGTFEEGWLIGNLIGNGSILSTQWGKTALLRYWEDSQEEMGKHAVALLEKTVDYAGTTESGHYYKQRNYRVIQSTELARLAASYDVTLDNKMPTRKIEEASYAFYCGFLRGLFDADGSVQGSQQKGISIRLSQSNLETLKIVQRMLARLGIISTIYQERRNEGYRYLPDSNRQPALYHCKAQHELVISNDNIYVFQDIIGFQKPDKASRLNKLISGYKRKLNRERFVVKIKEIIPDGVEAVFDCTVPGVSRFDANGIVAHNCGEIIGNNFHCNLAEVHLNKINPDDYKEQDDAFKAAALSVAALLHHKFAEPIYQESRELDPIVGVSFTGLFDFFVHAFGVKWLEWWQSGRQDTEEGKLFKSKEQKYLTRWKNVVSNTVQNYCTRHKLKTPNRATTVQPSGCLDRTALRIFDQGLIYADEVLTPGVGEVTGLNLTVRNGIAASTGIANKPLQLIKVTLNNGRILRMTPNHRLSIGGRWVYASDMTAGMTVDFSIGEYNNHQETSLLDINQFEYTREARKLEIGHNRGIVSTMIKMPKTMSPDLAYFIGALFGNGCLSSGNRIRISSGNHKLLKRLQQLAQELFQTEGRILKYSDRDAYELCFSSVQLFDWLELNNIAKIEKSKNLDRIPLAIRCSSKESILSFFSGLIDTDGCIRSTGTLSIDSASELFIRNLQQIGEAVGLCFSIFHNTEGQNKQSQKSMWGLSLSRTLSKLDALNYLNNNSLKAQYHSIPISQRNCSFNPFGIKSVEWETSCDYSYDFAIKGVDDNDSWYWQGAIKSHNTKSLLTGASPGWHPPKAQRFIRRITFRKNDPVAMACIDYGYNVVPSQTDKDEHGNLLDNPFDERCTEWLVEIPVAVSWADIPGVENIDVSKFSVLAQFDFYMQVQKYYTTHNTSATLELREGEIQELGEAIYNAIQNDDGYISAAILSRFDDHQSYPRLPFEPINKDTYLQLVKEVSTRKVNNSFLDALYRYDFGEMVDAGPSPCDSDKCLLPEVK